jgi:hypothetical protein
MAKPTITARFSLDSDGRPEVLESGGLKHYHITLGIDGAPDDTYAVTYQLHETYYNPSRESRRRSEGFTQDITSFGNFTIQARIRTSTHVETVAADLYQALRRSHNDASRPEVAEALENIHAN